MRKIKLELHKVDEKYLMLESQDVYKFVGESTNADMDLALYVDKWCEYLNWFIGGMHNNDMKFADGEYYTLKGWLNGYNFAKKYDVTHKKGIVEIKGRNLLIELAIPFEI